MKKLIFLLLACFVFLPLIYADDNWGIKNRSLEFGFLNFNLGFSNDFITTSDIFKEKVVIDLDKLEEGLNMNFGFATNPFFFNYNYKNIFGFGITTGMNFYGDLTLSGKLLTFYKESADGEEGLSDLNAAAFAEAGVPVFLSVNKIKIKAQPSLYYPVLYMKTEKMSYLHKVNAANETIIDMNIDIRAYYLFDDDLNITAKPGVDFNLGVEFPLSEMLGIDNSLLFFLNLDIGLDLINIPLFSSTMKNYFPVKARFGGGEPINFFGDEGTDSLFKMEESTAKEDEISIYRPFKMLAWVNWRPLGSPLLTITPSIGFSRNPIYVEPFSFEGSLKGSLNIFNLFIVTFTTGHMDRLWKNSLDLALNLRASEVNLGIAMQSRDYAKSWTGGGFGVRFGTKFGW
jgi:hypothetical protein